MKQLVIDESNAKKIYPKASDEFKSMLEDTFGKPFFSQKITDRINTIEDVLEYHGLDQEDAWDDDEEADVIAYKQAKLITSALNEKWVPNYNNSNQAKWSIWWYLNEPGCRLHDVGYGNANSFVGSRLVFKDEKLARHAADKFKDVYKALLT